MSTADESAIDHLVSEALEGRAAAEAADAPEGAPLDAAGEDEDDVVADGASSDADADGEIPDIPASPSIGFADGGADTATTDELDILRSERDGYLADSQRLAADFANYRKQSEKRVADAAAAQSASLIRDLLPVLDACDSALVQDPESAAGPIRSALITELEKNGLELLAPSEAELFDPELHEAVMHEAADADSDHDDPIVGEVLRAGYLWKGRVVRPAMVKVIG